MFVEARQIRRDLSVSTAKAKSDIELGEITKDSDSSKVFKVELYRIKLRYVPISIH